VSVKSTKVTVRETDRTPRLERAALRLWDAPDQPESRYAYDRGTRAEAEHTSATPSDRVKGKGKDGASVDAVSDESPRDARRATPADGVVIPRLQIACLGSTRHGRCPIHGLTARSHSTLPTWDHNPVSGCCSTGIARTRRTEVVSSLTRLFLDLVRHGVHTRPVLALALDAVAWGQPRQRVLLDGHREDAADGGGVKRRKFVHESEVRVVAAIGTRGFWSRLTPGRQDVKDNNKPPICEGRVGETPQQHPALKTDTKGSPR
jgi:hypothetical protein